VIRGGMCTWIDFDRCGMAKLMMSRAIHLGRVRHRLFPPFKYKAGRVPKGYKCDGCGVYGVRLYRHYQTFLEHQVLRCRSCALESQKQTKPDSDYEHSIGWMVAAVPTEDGTTYWGYTSVPQEGVEWWDRLPKYLF